MQAQLIDLSQLHRDKLTIGKARLSAKALLVGRNFPGASGGGYFPFWGEFLMKHCKDLTYVSTA